MGRWGLSLPKGATECLKCSLGAKRRWGGADGVSLMRLTAEAFSLVLALSVAGLAQAQEAPASPRIAPNPRPDLDALKAALDPAKTPPLCEAVYQKNTGYEEYGPQGPYWPERASRLGVSGVAVLTCAASPSGKLSACTTLAVAPANFGFELAGLKMAQRGYLTVAPDPTAHDGDLCRIVLVFKNLTARR